MVLFEELFLILSGHSILITLIGATMGGEGALLFLSALSGQGVMFLPTILITFYLGSVFMDLVAFKASKSGFVKSLFKKKLVKKFKSIVRKMIGKFNDQVFIILLITKFLYGTRYITIIYLGTKRVKLRKFLFYDMVITAVWMAILVPIGWLAGKGISFLVDIYNNFQLTLTLTIAFLFVVLFIRRIIVDKYVVS